MKASSSGQFDAPIRFTLTVCTLLLLAALVGCGRQLGEEKFTVIRGEVVEQVGDVAVLRLNAPAFSSLPLNDRIAAYYVSNAILAGRDIAYDQIHPRHLDIRRFFEEIGLNISYGAPSYFTDPFWIYLKTIWIHNGFYDLRSLNKLPTPISDREFDYLMYLALSNSGGKLGTLKEINLKRAWIVENLFNPDSDPILLARRSSEDAKASKHSIVNFYEDVSIGEARDFPDRYSRNSKLVKRKGQITELVCRTGDENLAAGPYAQQLEKVIENLENARPYLSPNRVAVADHLISHFRTGDPASYYNAAQLWRQSDAPVDFILGFNDQRFDPLEKKGLWTGMLFITDEKAQELLSRTADTARELLKAFPGYQADLFPLYNERIKAVQLLCAIGNNGPLCPDIYYDPPIPGSAEKQKQSLIFTNVVSARAAARARHIEAAFCIDKKERELSQRYSADLAFAEAAVGLMLGPATGAPGDISAIQVPDEEISRAILRCAWGELARLWVITDPEMVTIGLLPDAEASREVYRRFFRLYVHSFAENESANEMVRNKAIQLIGNGLYLRGEPLTEPDWGEGGSSLLPDTETTRQWIGELGRQMATLLATGNTSEQDRFIFEHTASGAPMRHSEILALRKNRGLFAREAFILPLVQAEVNPMGGITDVYLEQPRSFTAEMFRFGGWPIERDN